MEAAIGGRGVAKETITHEHNLAIVLMGNEATPYDITCISALAKVLNRRVVSLFGSHSFFARYR